MPHRTLVAVLLSASAGLALLAPSAPASAQTKGGPPRNESAAAKALVASIEPAQPSFRAAEPVNLRFTLSNGSGAPLLVLKWHTPLEGFQSDLFRVTRDGRPVRYIGRLVKRGAPLPQDYVKIEAGGSATAVVDLAEGYDLTAAGRYDVELATEILEVRPEGADLSGPIRSRPAPLRSAAAAVQLAEDRPPRHPEAAPAPPSKPKAGTAKAGKEPASVGCSDSRMSQASDALTRATQVSAGALLALAGTNVSKRPSATRYTTWFGTYDAGRYDTVQNHFQAIHDALLNQQITFVCDCDGQSYYAYVYPNDPYRIHLCDAFWTAPIDGTDTKFGTLIHETSHFYVVAGTKDNAYGQTACKALATNDPAKAVANADSHEYFAENNPALPMGLGTLVFTVLLLAVLTLAWRLRRRAA